MSKKESSSLAISIFIGMIFTQFVLHVTPLGEIGYIWRSLIGGLILYILTYILYKGLKRVRRR